MTFLKKLKTLAITFAIATLITACGGGDSSSNNSSDSTTAQTGTPSISGNYIFRSGSENFNGTFTNNTVSLDFDGGNGTFVFVGSPARQVRMTLGSDTIIANLTVNGSNVVTGITLTSPDGVAFTGTRR